MLPRTLSIKHFKTPRNTPVILILLWLFQCYEFSSDFIPKPLQNTTWLRIQTHLSPEQTSFFVPTTITRNIAKNSWNIVDILPYRMIKLAQFSLNTRTVILSLLLCAVYCPLTKHFLVSLWHDFKVFGSDFCVLFVSLKLFLTEKLIGFQWREEKCNLQRDRFKISNR